MNMGPDPQNSSTVPYRLRLEVRLGIRTILSPDISQLGSITIGRPYKSTNGQMSGLRIVRPCKTSNWEMSGPAYKRTENCPTLQISLTEKCPDWELHVLFGITGECIESLSVFTSSKANELRVDCSLHRALCVVLIVLPFCYDALKLDTVCFVSNIFVFEHIGHIMFLWSRSPYLRLKYATFKIQERVCALGISDAFVGRLILVLRANIQVWT